MLKFMRVILMMMVVAVTFVGGKGDVWGFVMHIELKKLTEQYDLKFAGLYDDIVGIRLITLENRSNIKELIEKTIPQKFSTTTAAIEALEKKLTGRCDQRFVNLDSKIAYIDKAIANKDVQITSLNSQITTLTTRLETAEKAIKDQKNINFSAIVDEQLIEHTVIFASATTSVFIANYLGFWIGSKIGKWIGDQYNDAAIIPKRITYWTGVFVGIIGFNALNILTMKYWITPLRRYIR